VLTGPSKTVHSEIIKNPDVAMFLERCEYLVEPTEEEGKRFDEQFQDISTGVGIELPNNIISVDGSIHESSIDNKLPSTKVGYLKISTLLISLKKYASLRVLNNRYVDPFKVAELKDNNDSLNFALPSANIRWNGKDSVADGFRAVVDECLASVNTRFNADDPKTSLRSTLFHLASRRPDIMATGSSDQLKLHKCPYPGCEEEHIPVYDVSDSQFCPSCNKEVYPSDCLRLYEEVDECLSNAAVLTRFMNIIEHLLPIHYIRYLFENSKPSLGNMAFFKDGPLAIFGTAAWLHKTIMRYLYEINMDLKQNGYQNILIIGLIKTGQVVDHFNLIGKYVRNAALFSVDDVYRYKYIIASRDPASKGFGSETYFGQDFLYKTRSGRQFVFNLVYPFAVKNESGIDGDFHKKKVLLSNYPDLSKALALIEHFETDLYENAIVPIALAHKYTAISLVPGGKVLDILTRQALER
jgi:hypothetical protein